MNPLQNHWDVRSAEYNDFVVKGYSDLKERRAWQDHYASILGDGRLKVLDVGCGPGIVSMQLADLGHDVTSVDFSERMLEFARKNAADNGLSIDFRHGDAMSLDFDDSSFDAVVSGYMLWTVPDPEKVLSEWSRVLKPGHVLAYTDGDWFHDELSTPFRNRVSEHFVRRDRKALERCESQDSSLDCLWSAEAIRPRDDIRMLEDAGFEDIRVIENVQKKVLRGKRYLAYGFTNNHFTMTATKPSRRPDAYGIKPIRNRIAPNGLLITPRIKTITPNDCLDSLRRSQSRCSCGCCPRA